MAGNHYNWYIIEKVLVGSFNLIFKWTVTCYMKFSGPHGSVIITKENKFQPEYMEQILGKLGIELSEFDVAYEIMKGRSAR